MPLQKRNHVPFIVYICIAFEDLVIHLSGLTSTSFSAYPKYKRGHDFPTLNIVVSFIVLSFAVAKHASMTMANTMPLQKRNHVP
jgi:hypothetical protein